MDARTDTTAPSIQDRIAQAMASKKRIPNPDPNAHETAPEGAELLTGKAPLAARHLFSIFCELRDAHRGLFAAQFKGPGEASDETAAAHEQNHADTEAVHAALMGVMKEAFPDTNVEFSGFIMLKDWQVAGRYKTPEDELGLDDLPPELKALLGGGLGDMLSGLLGKGKIGISVRQIDSDELPDAFKIKTMTSGRLADMLDEVDEGGFDSLRDSVLEALGGSKKEGFGFGSIAEAMAAMQDDGEFQAFMAGLDDSISEEDAREMWDNMSATDGDPDADAVDSEILNILKRLRGSTAPADLMKLADDLHDFFTEAYGEDGPLQTTVEIGGGEMTFKTTIRF